MGFVSGFCCMCKLEEAEHTQDGQEKKGWSELEWGGEGNFGLVTAFLEVWPGRTRTTVDITVLHFDVRQIIRLTVLCASVTLVKELRKSWTWINISINYTHEMKCLYFNVENTTGWKEEEQLAWNLNDETGEKGCPR
ncbi:hypothetical protein SLEP1_g28016 [Rubroshorea leprosula]|uniref:Uncharacterized protein n=1 Tax=Rubroshorea leprosula TaxID=152421 RepID=A0AAV5JYB5_9ROSI|nr:hypothetical protein SLEP1_g28016 [Rubroshorea leprosula]